VLHAVTVLLDRSSHPDLEIFRIFEEAIGMLTENMTTSLRQFRTQTYRDLVSNLSSSLSDSDLDDDGPSETTKSIKRRYKHELERAQRENRENTSALLELRDMEDELATLSRLFESQEVVIRSMLATFASASLAPVTRHGQAYLSLALRRLEGYKGTTAEMAKRVDATRRDYEKLLEMAQRQAQVDDVRWSRIQTELASSQNLSVMIFTTFTVIFLPLSFFTGLFGMNTAEWQRDGGVPSLGFIGGIGLPVSAVLIVGSLVAAFSERVQGWFFAVWRVWKRGVRWWREGLERLTPRVVEERRRKRREVRERRRRKEERRRRERRRYDFWGSVKERRDAGGEGREEIDKKAGTSGRGRQ